MTDDLYDTDYMAWTKLQAELLRAGRLSEIDAKNLAAELDGLDRLRLGEVRSRLRMLFIQVAHRAFDLDPSDRDAEILELRAQIEDLWTDSMADQIDLADEWRRARAQLGETMRNETPEELPEAAIEWRR